MQLHLPLLRWAGLAAALAWCNGASAAPYSSSTDELQARGQATTFNNCSGLVPTAPQLNLTSVAPDAHPSGAWQTYEMTISEATNTTLMLFSWSMADHKVDVGSFSLNISFSNGSFYEAVWDDLAVSSTRANDNVQVLFKDSKKGASAEFSVGQGSIQSNISLPDGLRASFSGQVLPASPLVPAYNGQASQLVPGYFVDVIGPRVHLDGTLQYPGGETWAVLNVASFTHSWGTKPRQDVLSSSTRFHAWTGLEVPPASFSYLGAAAKKSSIEGQAAQLSLAVPAVNIYSVPTADKSLFNFTAETQAAQLTFAGCALTDGHDYQVESLTAREAIVVDDGARTFHVLNVTMAQVPYKGQVTKSTAGLGILEIYNGRGK